MYHQPAANSRLTQGPHHSVPRIIKRAVKGIRERPSIKTRREPFGLIAHPFLSSEHNFPSGRPSGADDLPNAVTAASVSINLRPLNVADRRGLPQVPRPRTPPESKLLE